MKYETKKKQIGGIFNSIFMQCAPFSLAALYFVNLKKTSWEIIEISSRIKKFNEIHFDHF